MERTISELILELPVISGTRSPWCWCWLPSPFPYQLPPQPLNSLLLPPPPLPPYLLSSSHLLGFYKSNFVELVLWLKKLFISIKIDIHRPKLTIIQNYKTKYSRFKHILVNYSFKLRANIKTVSSPLNTTYLVGAIINMILILLHLTHCCLPLLSALCSPCKIGLFSIFEFHVWKNFSASW